MDRPAPLMSACAPANVSSLDARLKRRLLVDDVRADAQQRAAELELVCILRRGEMLVDAPGPHPL